jgi:hypothetical protein
MAPAPPIGAIVSRSNHVIIGICCIGGGIAITIAGISPIPISIAVTVASASAARAGRLHDDGSGGIAAAVAAAPAAGSGGLSAGTECEERSEEQQSRDAAVIE